MNNTIAIVGAGGQARAIITLAEYTYRVVGIYDDTYVEHKAEFINAYKINGKINDLYHVTDKLALAIGNNYKRAELYLALKKKIIDNLLHPTSIIESYTNLGKANYIHAQVYINSNVMLGENNIINTGSVLEHEVEVRDHCHISVRAVVCGRVKIGSYCMIGAGSVIKDNITICDHVTIGAGAVVVNNINTSGTYIGVPARKIL